MIYMPFSMLRIIVPTLESLPQFFESIRQVKKLALPSRPGFPNDYVGTSAQKMASLELSEERVER